jgi:hypothetical protein
VSHAQSLTALRDINSPRKTRVCMLFSSSHRHDQFISESSVALKGREGEQISEVLQLLHSVCFWRIAWLQQRPHMNTLHPSIRFVPAGTRRLRAAAAHQGHSQQHSSPTPTWATTGRLWHRCALCGGCCAYGTFWTLQHAWQSQLFAWICQRCRPCSGAALVHCVPHVWHMSAAACIASPARCREHSGQYVWSGSFQACTFQSQQPPMPARQTSIACIFATQPTAHAHHDAKCAGYAVAGRMPG